MFKKIMRTRTLMIALLLFLLIGTASWRIYSSQQQAVVSTQPLAVTTAEAKRTTKANALQLSGTVEGLVSALVSSRFTGKIEQIFIEDGQAVTKGEALIVLDPVELENSVRLAQNNVHRTEANYHTAETDYQRYQFLYEKNAISKQQLESAEARMISSRSDVGDAYANLNNAQKQMADGSIKSPVTGMVANKSATIGQVVAQGTTLLTVEQMDQVYVVVHVEQKDIAAAKMGAKVNVTVDAYPNQIFAGTIAVINPVAGNESRMFRVKIKIDNSQRLLKPGMFAQSTLHTGAPIEVLTVPRNAIMASKGLRYVYVDAKGQAKKTLVETGDLIGELIEIKSGLQPGVAVVIDNLDKIKDGDALRSQGDKRL